MLLFLGTSCVFAQPEVPSSYMREGYGPLAGSFRTQCCLAWHTQCIARLQHALNRTFD
jgi:hypothetical protein